MIIDGTNLSMIRGDSESITVKIREPNGEQIPLVDGDTIYFTMKVNAASEQKILQKIITVFDDGEAVIEIDPSDTKNLPVRSYRYDIQWVTSLGRVSTIVPPAVFTLLQEVTTD